MFVSFEGIDRSGKTTQARLLAEALGPKALLVREPGGSEAGEQIRTLLKDPATPLSPVAELLLFGAARAELVTRVIRPALAAGRDVVCDRFTDSSLAYQGAARGLGREAVKRLNEIATGGLRPDATVLIRIDPATAVARRHGGEDEADAGDRFEDEGVAFQAAVAAAYDEIAARHRERFVVIDGAGSIQDVQRAVLAALNLDLDLKPAPARR